MAEMIRLYLQEIPQLVQVMKIAIVEQDWVVLKSATHSIIPTFATMGIKPEFEAAAKVIQTLAAGLTSGEISEEASVAIFTRIHTLFLTTETVCASAAQELEEKLLILEALQIRSPMRALEPSFAIK